MTLDTVFDLASLTKPIATATSIMVLVERGAIGLDDPLVKYVPECDSGGQARDHDPPPAPARVRIARRTSSKDDFAHGRGRGHPPHLRDPAPRRRRERRRCTATWGSCCSKRSCAASRPASCPPSPRRRSSRRSACGTPASCPPDELRQRAAWTEFVDGEWRVGVVHDPRAYLLGGVAGHAGLFSTADDLALYARAILGGGAVDGRRILSPGTVATMIAPYDVPGGIRALGWSVREPVERRRPLAEGDRALRVHRHGAVDRSGQGSLRPRL